jgi:Glycosyl hydrolase family 99
LRTTLIILKITLLFLATYPVAAEPLRLQPDANDPIPIMAYYYIWFDVQSWDRAKTDYPQLGRYSSDDPAILTQHVVWAKETGIDGFIVSWKSTFQLDSRLEKLMEIAAANDFQLWIIYQGLDFERNPLPIGQIDSDLSYFLERFAEHPAFQMYDRPVVIWSGTWEFSREEIEAVTMNYRDRLYVLASERNVDGYLRLADLVDGNAYYWSSVNPATFRNYYEKLDTMGQAVHEHGGLWVAPAAPGFDARLIGGSQVVERNDGETLRIELNTALRSSPDAIGLISWNEFSENTHIEPSEKYGTRALDILAGREASSAPIILDFDSSSPGTTNIDDLYPLYVLGGALVLTIGSLLVVITRRAMAKE